MYGLLTLFDSGFLELNAALYCSVMQDDPVRYWQDVTDNYRQMSDGELLELAEKPEDLTDVAQQVLRDEMNRRRLKKQPPEGVRQRTVTESTEPYDPVTGAFPNVHVPYSESEGSGEEAEDGESGQEFTWKTPLCDCESNEHAWQLRKTLRLAGIDSWVREVPRSSADVVGPQVWVAADQLDHACAIAAQPIPQEIVDEVKWESEPQTFEVPVCPKCGAPDPVLDSVDPVNFWHCDVCEAEWTDPLETASLNSEGSPAN